MNQQKDLWEKLAKSNSKYYINSDYGKGITEEEFLKSGEADYKKYIADDPLIDPRHRNNVLEIGCGSGRMTEFIDNNFDNVYALDISEEMIDQGIKRLGNDTIKWIVGDGYTFPLPDNSIDFAFSYIVFQHFKTMEMIESNFKESYRVLKPGGLMKVRVRTNQSNLDDWWGGVSCDESVALQAGFKLLKKELVGDYGLWLWLEK